MLYHGFRPISHSRVLIWLVWRAKLLSLVLPWSYSWSVIDRLPLRVCYIILIAPVQKNKHPLAGWYLGQRKKLDFSVNHRYSISIVLHHHCVHMKYHQRGRVGSGYSKATNHHKGAIVQHNFNDSASNSIATQISLFLWRSFKGSSQRQCKDCFLSRFALSPQRQCELASLWHRPSG